MKDKPKLILVGDEWTQGSYIEASTSSDMAIENSFRKFFNVTNLGFLQSSPRQSLKLLEHYLQNIELRGNFPRSNITVVFVLGIMFRDMTVPQVGILDAHRQSVFDFLTELGTLTKRLLPNSTHDANEHKMGWFIVGGSTDISAKIMNSIIEFHEDQYSPSIIHSWCAMVEEAYMATPFSHDPDRILVNSDIEPGEVTVIEMMMRKRREYDRLVGLGLLSEDYIPTEMMTDQLAEYIHSNAINRFSEVSYIGQHELHDSNSKKHWLKKQ